VTHTSRWINATAGDSLGFQIQLTSPRFGRAVYQSCQSSQSSLMRGWLGLDVSLRYLFVGRVTRGSRWGKMRPLEQFDCNALSKPAITVQREQQVIQLIVSKPKDNQESMIVRPRRTRAARTHARSEERLQSAASYWRSLGESIDRFGGSLWDRRNAGATLRQRVWRSGAGPEKEQGRLQ
jgi:hypothetical protein